MAGTHQIQIPQTMPGSEAGQIMFQHYTKFTFSVPVKVYGCSFWIRCGEDSEGIVESVSVMPRIWSSSGLVREGNDGIVHDNTGAFYYFPLYNPVILNANTEYFIGFFSLGNGYYKSIPSAGSTTMGQVTVNYNPLIGKYIYIYNRQDYRNPFNEGNAYSPPAVILHLDIANQSPTAPTPYAPGHGVTYNDDAVPSVQWGFNDPDPGNTQGAWAVHVIDHNTNTIVRDTGWQSGNGSVWTISPALSAGAYRYRIITRDQNGAEGPWSWEPIFYVNSRPNAPSITSPGWDTLVNSRTPIISWSFNDPDAGSWQSAFYVELVNGAYNAVLWNSGWMSSDSGSYQIPAGVIASDGNYYVRVQVRDQHGHTNRNNGNSPDAAYGNILFKVDTTAPTGTIQGSQKLNIGTNGTFRVHAYGVSDQYGVSAVRFPTSGPGYNFTWRDGSYYADGIWFCDIPINEYNNNEGVYTTHIYAYDSAGNSSFLGETFVTVDRANPTPGTIDGHSFEPSSSGTVRKHTYNWTDAGAGISYSHAYWMKNSIGTWNGPYDAIPWNNGETGQDYYYDFPRTNGDGAYTVRFWVYDGANNGSYLDTSYTVDNVAPNANDAQTSNVKATTAVLTWNAFNDPAPSSGWQRTLVYLERWNGSTWERIMDGLSVGNVTTHTFTGLLASSSYRAAVHHFDNAGHTHSTVWTPTFVTNTLPAASILNLSSSGSLYNQRPTLIMSGSDANNDGLTFHLQIATGSDFSGLQVDTTSNGAAGWSTTVSVAPGVNVYYKPQGDLGVGTRYARVQSHDGKDWGPWSATETFVISAPNWSDTIQDSFTGVKKAWVDEIRNRIQQVWAARELGVPGFTDTLTANATQVKAQHLTELRSAIQTVHSTLGLGTINWTDPTITSDVTERKGKHWNELRNAIMQA